MPFPSGYPNPSVPIAKVVQYTLNLDNNPTLAADSLNIHATNLVLPSGTTPTSVAGIINAGVYVAPVNTVVATFLGNMVTFTITYLFGAGNVTPIVSMGTGAPNYTLSSPTVISPYSTGANWFKSGEPVDGSVFDPPQDDGYMNRPVKQLFENTDWLSQQIYDIINNVIPNQTLTQVYFQGIYQVGAMYLSLTYQTPAQVAAMFGFGTWNRVGTGRVLMGEGQTTDTNGEIRNYQNTPSIAAVPKKFRFTVNTNAASGDRINIGGMVRRFTGGHGTAALTAAAIASLYTNHAGTENIVSITNPSGAIVEITLSPEAGNQPTVSLATTGFTISALSVHQNYVAPVFGNLGGEYGHALTPPENAPHNHTYDATSNASSGTVIPTDDLNDGLFFTSVAGSGLRHNNVQPYFLCYIWQRVS